MLMVFLQMDVFTIRKRKTLKMFGDADNDALSIIKHKLHIEMVTGDKRG